MNATNRAVGVVVGVASMLPACGAQPARTEPQPEPTGAPASSASDTRPPQVEQVDWAPLEAPTLTRHVQLTTREKFVKAGEAYFDPSGTWIVFQAVAVPEAGQEPDPFYAMYVAKLTRDEQGYVSGIETPIRISEPGSANTCGWFHPTNPGVVMFGSTTTRPSDESKSGFQVGTRKYVWQFPSEMDVVTRFVKDMWVDRSLQKGREPQNVQWPKNESKALPVFQLPEYDAECSWDKRGRHVLYSHVREERTGDRPDADIYIYDMFLKKHFPIVTADGYDGGPFFSPDGMRICYRSDRRLDDHLQLFIADLEYTPQGEWKLKAEHPLTDNEHVNWGPFWHPSGTFLVYGTSQMGHQNYEVFAIPADTSRAPSELEPTRLTFAPGADVLPAFSADGRMMMWCTQRGPAIEGEARPSSQIWLAEFHAPEGLINPPERTTP